KSPELSYEWKLVKAADKLSALIKCMEEEKTGNKEFVKAKEATAEKVDKLSEEYPEVKDFVKEFLGAYSKTLDELN
ncbi:MAG: 5'-deoxynucleotidase, partial [Lachnospiraceae bacterium]|nr:5'-deoxynucleotidase [Lachnospiraceae bacterium]